jgi:hypothetical protein
MLGYNKSNQTVSNEVKQKYCPKCEQSLPISSFTSTRAKNCNQCKRIIQLEQKQEMIQRALVRVGNKKQKKQVVISLSDLRKAVQNLVNRYCKLRDIKDGCISCTKGKSEQGGHFINQGSCYFLRYNLDNIHGQCVSCNHFKRGNLLEYRIRLVQKIGEDRVKWLEAHRHEQKKWTREELEEIRRDVKEKIKLLPTSEVSETGL